jgi:hypothetical protein
MAMLFSTKFKYPHAIHLSEHASTLDFLKLFSNLKTYSRQKLPSVGIQYLASSKGSPTLLVCLCKHIKILIWANMFAFAEMKSQRMEHFQNPQSRHQQL